MAITFTVEVGDSDPNANSYVAVAFADTYHEEQNNTSWASATTTNKELALVKATRYVDMRFGPRFRGVREQRDQGLEWPRLGARDNDGFLFIDSQDIPRQLKYAVCEYAFRVLTLSDLAPDPVATDRGEIIAEKKVVGPIETETKYATNKDSAAFSAQLRAPQSGLVDDALIPQYPQADMWLAELIRSGHTTRLRRS